MRRWDTLSPRAVIGWVGLLLALSAVGLGGSAPPPGEEPLRLQGALARLARAVDLAPPQLEALAAERGIALRAGRVPVVVEAASSARVRALRAGLAALGGVDLAQFGLWLKARVPVASLVPLARLDGVRYVRSPFVPRPAGVISEGVSLIGAQTYHRAGFTGQGVTMAVIDLGFEGLAEAFANGDLPSQIEQFDYTGTGMGGLAHGTAVSEIVHDVAPGAKLLLMKVANEVDLGRAVEEAIRQGARVINHSVVWFNTEFGDGTGGVSQIAEQAVARGVAWVNAAGNTALLHWKGPFRDADDDGWVEFDPGGSESLSLQADAGELVEVFLNWDAWPRTAFDYDLFLTFDENGNGLVDPTEFSIASTDPQRGPDPPLEQVTLIAPQSGRYLISVAYRGGAAPPPLEIFTSQHALRTPVREGSVLAPATAPSALAVGAVDSAQWAAGTVQPFSAWGPTDDGRLKPELLAPDNVRTWVAGRFPLQFGSGGRFSGTSASAPHVSGALALLLEETPGMTAQQGRLRLTRDARDLPPAGPDNHSGFGQVQLRLQPSPTLEPVLSGLALSATTVEAGETVTLSLTVANPHFQPIGVTLPFLVDGAPVAVRELVLEAGQAQGVSFTWQFAQAGTHTLGVGELPPLTVRVVQPLRVMSAVLRAGADRALTLEVQGQGVMRVRLELFDLAGRRRLSASSEGPTLRVPLRDASGRPLANGVYLARITIEGATRREVLPVKKLLVLY